MAGRVVSYVRIVELLATAVIASPAAFAVPNVNAGVVSEVNLGIGVTEIPISPRPTIDQPQTQEPTALVVQWI